MKKSVPKVSIIVPVYNTEKYLRQCLDSITGQTLKNIEIILVNDGSTDGSLKIMQEYARHDRRIQIIDKPNEGYGKTMNRGLDAAASEYIGIVESDDWIKPDMYAALYALAKKHDCDVVKSNYFEHLDEKNQKVETLPPYLLNRVICARNHQNNEVAIFYSAPSIWSAIYRRAFINQKKIRFLESAGASYQDVGFNFKVWALADKIWLTPRAFLYYRQHPQQSVVGSTGKVFCVRDEWREIERFMKDYPEWQKSSVKLRNQVKLGNYKWNLHRLEGADKEAFRQCFAREYKNALQNDELELSLFSRADLIEFLYLLEPANVWLRLQYYALKVLRKLWNIGRTFLKSLIKSNKQRSLLRKIKARIRFPLPRRSQEWSGFSRI